MARDDLDYGLLIRDIGAIGDLIEQLQTDEVWPRRREILDELEAIRERMLQLLAEAGPPSAS